MSVVAILLTLVPGTALLLFEWYGLLGLALAAATRSGPYAGPAIANILVGVILGGPVVIEIGTLLGTTIYSAVRNYPAHRTLVRLNVLIWVFVVVDTLYLVFFAGAFGVIG